MGFFARLASDWIYLRKMLIVTKRIEHTALDMTDTAADIIEPWVHKRPDNIAIEFDDRRYTYREFDAAANRYARWAQGLGLKQGDTVALLMENRPEFLFAWLGMAKIGVTTALINTNQQAAALAHSLTISHARHLILGLELADNYATAQDRLEEPLTVWATGGPMDGAQDLDAALASQSDAHVGREARPDLRGRDVCFYIYTSGTTGLPKAARFSHMRMHTAMHGFSGSAEAQESDRMYMVLPLYHSAGGVCAIGTVLSVGGTVILRRKFSASHFWQDVHDSRATMFQYIGELCRYLLQSPEHPLERQHSLRTIIGNGLRPEIWSPFQERFAIPRIVEFYGATEGNVTLFNYDGKAGSVGRVPWFARSTIPVDLVQFDVEAEQPRRGPDGLCLPCAPGEVGEAVGKISEQPRTQFEGYSSKQATEKKVLHDVFEPGDSYFRTGDLMRRDENGYYYFVDRIGDTFRWKGENVATSEVAEAISVFPGVAEANVYGVQVPHTDGRAGMAALVTPGEMDLNALYAHLADALPAYAMPVFLRLQPAIEITATFKHRKVDLVKDGYDPNTIEDPLFIRDDERGTYVPLTSAMIRRLESGEVRL